MVGEAFRDMRDLEAMMTATSCSGDATGVMSRVASTIPRPAWPQLEPLPGLPWDGWPCEGDPRRGAEAGAARAGGGVGGARGARAKVVAGDGAGVGAWAGMGESGFVLRLAVMAAW